MADLSGPVVRALTQNVRGVGLTPTRSHTFFQDIWMCHRKSNFLYKQYLAYNRINGLPYLGINSVVYLWVSTFVCWLLPFSGQVWPILECIGYQITKKATTFGLNYTFIRIVFTRLLSVMCFVIAKYLCMINYSYNTVQFSYILSIFLSKMSWPILYPKGILRILYLPNSV